jgi:FkbM family methyltransferase
MNLRAKAIQITHSNSLGMFAIKSVRQTLDFIDHISHPGVPADRQITRVKSNGKTFSILHRRTYADRHVIQQCFAQDQYHVTNHAHSVYIDHVYQRILASGRKPLIVDCGANIGASLLWHAAWYPEAHFVAIEPAADNFSLLRGNCSGIDVDLRQAGVAASDGIASLIDPGEGGWAYQTVSSGDGPQVSMLALAPLVSSKIEAGYTPFLLKIDIEGAESTLFDGDCSLINSFPLIIMEPHDWLLPGQHTSAGFFRFHAAYGREFCMKGENIGSISVDDSILGIPVWANKKPAAVKAASAGQQASAVH